MSGKFDDAEDDTTSSIAFQRPEKSVVSIISLEYLSFRSTFRLKREYFNEFPFYCA